MNRYLDMVESPIARQKTDPGTIDPVGRRDSARTDHPNWPRTAATSAPTWGWSELTIALHRIFSTPHDKFVWDVSHQSYVHKLLTGRKNRFDTIRTTDGLNGFRAAHRKRARLLRRGPCRHGPFGGAGHVRSGGISADRARTWSAFLATPP